MYSDQWNTKTKWNGKGLFLSFSSFYDFTLWRCFSHEACFLCFLPVISLFIGMARLCTEAVGAFSGVSLGKQGEHLYWFINWNDNSIEKSIHTKQETSEIVSWAHENKPLESHRLNWKKPLYSRLRLYLREQTYPHIQFSVFHVLCVPINQIMNMDNHKQM